MSPAAAPLRVADVTFPPRVKVNSWILALRAKIGVVLKLTVVAVTLALPPAVGVPQFALPLVEIPVANCPPAHCVGLDASDVAVPALPVVFWFSVGTSAGWMAEST
jgi:hypothetical protein